MSKETSSHANAPTGLAVAEAEYSRIERELHEGLCQDLAALIFRLECLPAATRDDPALRKVRELADKAMLRTRGLAADLQPTGLFQEGLFSGLAQLTDDLSARYGVACFFECQQHFSLDGEKALLVFRIVQELLKTLMAWRSEDLTVEFLREAGNTYRIDITARLPGAVAAVLRESFRSPALELRLRKLKGSLEFFSLAAEPLRFSLTFSEQPDASEIATVSC